MVLLFNVSNGLIVGLFYALMALGLALILTLNNVVNFAHGGFMTLGAYIAYTVEQRFGFWAGLVLAPIAVGTVTAPLGRSGVSLGGAADLIHDLSVQVLSPVVLLAAAAGLVALCLSGRWKPGEPDPGPDPQPARPGAPRPAA